MELDKDYILMAVLTIILIVLLVAQSCQRQGDVSDSYGINIKVNRPAKAYTLEAGQ